jgi:hypothetical protein
MDWMTYKYDGNKLAKVAEQHYEGYKVSYLTNGSASQILYQYDK